MSRKSIKYTVLIALIIASIYAIFFSPVKTFLTEDNIRSFVEQFGMFAPVAYGVLYYLVALIGISAAALTILSGLLFGKLIGLTIVVISATLAASTAFIIARYFGKNLTTKLAKKKKIGPWIKKIESQVGKNGFQAFFIMRCLFLPYIPLSYAAGLVKSAKLSDFTLATFTSNIIISFIFVYLGDNLLKGPEALILPLILVILALQLPKIIKRLRKE